MKEKIVSNTNRMPAEWQPHCATWLAWPHDRMVWRDCLEDVKKSFVEMVRWLSSGERVHILVSDAVEEKDVRVRLVSVGICTNIFLHRIKTGSVWIRDFGPIFIKNAHTTHVIDWKFNAWGGKYPSLLKDNLIPGKIATLRKLKRLSAPMVLEGGSIDVNGNGACLATEECLLHPNRNPKLSRQTIEGNLRKYLGIKKVIWLHRGMQGDDTDGHIDCVARFVGPRTIVAVCDKTKSGIHHEIFRENLRMLEMARDVSGKRFRLIRLPMPGKVTVDGKKIPATYANFYIANHVVLVPVFGTKNDRHAISILKKVFPTRQVVGINCRALAKGLGAIHCATQQEPV